MKNRLLTAFIYYKLVYLYRFDFLFPFWDYFEKNNQIKFAYKSQLYRFAQP